MIAEHPDKRRGQRIRTALPVFLKNAEGITRDVSASGVFFWTSVDLCAPGEMIDFSMKLDRPDGKVMLKCRGDVVRTEIGVTGTGVAVKIIDSTLSMA